MNAYEILEELERLFIITRIGDEYFISQDIIKSRNNKTVTVVESSPIKAVTEYTETLDKPDKNSRWPFEILETRGKFRAKHFIYFGNVPSVSTTGYRLRGLNDKAVKFIDVLVHNNPNLKATVLFEEISYYYKTTEYPKAFRNFILEGDMMDLYDEAIEREKKGVFRINPNDANSNTTWG